MSKRMHGNGLKGGIISEVTGVPEAIMHEMRQLSSETLTKELDNKLLPHGMHQWS